MKKSELKILIVEDDSTAGKALQEGLHRQGYQVRWTKDPEEALKLFKLTDYHLMILDCMLPKRNGVQLAKELRSVAVQDFKIIFTSGIFKDKKFIQDAINQVHATVFLAKPFDLEKINEVIESCFSEDLEASKEPIFELLERPKVTFKDVENALETVDSLDGLHLPWIYSLLHFSKFTGKLHIQPSEGEPCISIWENGVLIDLQMKDKESYFGVLLVEMGFTSPEEVEKSLASQGGKPIGQLLIDANALSPHAVNIVRSEQLAIRLSKTIQENPILLQLSPENVRREDLHLTESQFSRALQDWVTSKLTPQWLSNFYLQWLDSTVKVTENLDRITRVKEAKIFESHGDLWNLINGQTTLQALIDQNPENETQILQILHYGILEKVFFFGKKQKKTADFKSITQRLNRMAERIDEKNHFEILGLSAKAKSKEVNKTYLELAKAFHPDRMDPQAPTELKKLTEKVFSYVTKAYETLKDDESRSKYIRELEIGQASQALRYENQFDQAKELLSRGKLKEADQLLQVLLSAKYNPGQVRIHTCWCQLKAAQNREMTATELSKIQDLINQIPPEDRHSSSFFLVKGLFAEAMGDLRKAITFWRNAVAIDPKMIDAKRELSRILRQKPNRPRSSTGEWTALVSNFFKK
ncbi:MAG: response regulator [Bdellovibrionales bacterium]|nr:response regulator [Bdellovibrionales bacterium]